MFSGQKRMNYEQTLYYLYNRLPMFHRIGKAAYKADLHNTLSLCAHLGNPERQFRSIHIAGTNGKGSTSHLLAAILQAAGYRTGLYTSPHLKSFTERIRINGTDIPQEEVVKFVEENKSFIEALQPSFFEMTVGLAFDYFARQQVDIAVIEVGLGGRLDSTNVITPLLSLITNISFDHQDILGDTLQKIASEKAGIIKPHVPVVISEIQPEVVAVFEEKALQAKAPLYFAPQTYQVKSHIDTATGMEVEVWKEEDLYLENLFCPLTGDYQLKNIAGVLKAVDLLNQKGFDLDEASVRKGIGEVTSLTGLKGRWQILGKQPLIVCDTGHNEAGIKHVVDQINRQTFDTLYCVIGMVNDKDISHILPLFPKNAYYYFCQAQIPRAMKAEALKAEAAKYGLQGEAVPNVKEAFRAARQRATPEDMVFIGGSTFVVAEIEEL